MMQPGCMHIYTGRKETIGMRIIGIKELEKQDRSQASKKNGKNWLKYCYEAQEK
jgi:hypothetical protein